MDVRITGRVDRAWSLRAALGAVTVSIVSTIVIFVVIPALLVAVIAGLSLAGSGTTRRSRRYRPGRPYDFRPIWFLAAPDQVSQPADGRRTQPRAIASGVVEQNAAAPAGRTGGASDRW